MGRTMLHTQRMGDVRRRTLWCSQAGKNARLVIGRRDLH
jgi:hypothetical protein